MSISHPLQILHLVQTRQMSTRGLDDQETEEDEQEITEEETVDFDKFAESFAQFVQDQKAQKVKEEQEEAVHFFQLSQMVFGMSNLQLGNKQQTTAPARGQAAMGSGGSSSSSGSASSSSVAWRPAWHWCSVTQSQRDLLKKLCQEMKIEGMIQQVVLEPRDRGQASEHIKELIVMKKFQRDGRDKMG